uniref:Uncharacterized protein n=1 Tax=Pogona vitticeps TaxID=103695 RepID=A0ABM5FZM7_9SAUR
MDGADGGRVVVDVEEAHHHFAAGRQRGGAAVAGLHVELVGALELVVDGALEGEAARERVEAEELAGLGGHLAAPGVEQLPVGALVRVRGVQVEEQRARGRVLGQLEGQERAVRKGGRVVVGVQHPHADRGRARARRAAAVLGHQLQAVGGLRLAVQLAQQHQLGALEPVGAALRLQAEVAVGRDGEALDAVGAHVQASGCLCPTAAPGESCWGLRRCSKRGVGVLPLTRRCQGQEAPLRPYCGGRSRTVPATRKAAFSL